MPENNPAMATASQERGKRPPSSPFLPSIRLPALFLQNRDATGADGGERLADTLDPDLGARGRRIAIRAHHGARAGVIADLVFTDAQTTGAALNRAGDGHGLAAVFRRIGVEVPDRGDGGTGGGADHCKNESDESARDGASIGRHGLS